MMRYDVSCSFCCFQGGKRRSKRSEKGKETKLPFFLELWFIVGTFFLLLLVFVGGTTLGTLSVRDQEYGRYDRLFAEAARRRVLTIMDEFILYADSMEMVAKTMEGRLLTENDTIGPLDFATITAGNFMNIWSPAVMNAYVYIPLVTNASRAKFEAAISKAHGRDIEIYPGTVVFGTPPWPGSENATEFGPVTSTLAAPLQPLIGSDMLEESVRAESLFLSRRTNKGSFTKPVVLPDRRFGTDDLQPGLGVSAPVYRPRPHPDAGNESIPLLYRLPEQVVPDAEPLESDRLEGWIGATIFSQPVVIDVSRRRPESEEFEVLAEVIGEDGDPWFAETYGDVTVNFSRTLKGLEQNSVEFGSGVRLLGVRDLDAEAAEEEQKRDGTAYVFDVQAASGVKVYGMFLNEEAADKAYKDARALPSRPQRVVHFSGVVANQVWNFAVIARDRYVEETLVDPVVPGFAVGVPVSLVVAAALAAMLFVFRGRFLASRAAEVARVARERAVKGAHEASITYVAHELRNPLQVILGAGSVAGTIISRVTKRLALAESRRREGLVSDDVLGSEIVSSTEELRSILQDLDALMGSARVSERLIADLASVRTLSSTELSMRVSACDPLRTTLQACLTVAKMTSSAILVRVDPTVPPAFLTDATRVHQVVARFLETAARFAEVAGGSQNITVSVSTEAWPFASFKRRYRRFEDTNAIKIDNLCYFSPSFLRSDPSAEELEELVEFLGGAPTRAEVDAATVAYERRIPPKDQLIAVPNVASASAVKVQPGPEVSGEVPPTSESIASDPVVAAIASARITSHTAPTGGFPHERGTRHRRNPSSSSASSMSATVEGTAAQVSRAATTLVPVVVWRVVDHGRGFEEESFGDVMESIGIFRQGATKHSTNAAKKPQLEWAPSLERRKGASTAPCELVAKPRAARLHLGRPSSDQSVLAAHSSNNVLDATTPAGALSTPSRAAPPPAPPQEHAAETGKTPSSYNSRILGSALGLATAAKIANSLGGSISVFDAVTPDGEHVVVSEFIVPVAPPSTFLREAEESSAQAMWARIEQLHGLSTSLDLDLFPDKIRSIGTSDGVIIRDAPPDIIRWLHHEVRKMDLHTGGSSTKHSMSSAHDNDDMGGVYFEEGGLGASEGSVASGAPGAPGAPGPTVPPTESAPPAPTTPKKPEESPIKPRSRRKRRTREGGEKKDPERDGGGKLGYHVLVVDDDALVRRLVRRMLETMGCTVETCEDGDEVEPLLRKRGVIVGEEVEEERDDGKVPDVILMDIVMVRTDGADVTNHLVHDLGVKIPIIAVTSNHAGWDRERFSTSGFAAVAPKPITPDSLKSIMKQERRI